MTETQSPEVHGNAAGGRSESLFVRFAFHMWHAGLLGSLLYEVVFSAEWTSPDWFLDMDPAGSRRWWLKAAICLVYVLEWCFVLSGWTEHTIRKAEQHPRGKRVRILAAGAGVVTPLMLAIAAKYAGDATSPLATVWMLFLTALIYTIFQVWLGVLVRGENVFVLLMAAGAAIALGLLLAFGPRDAVWSHFWAIACSVVPYLWLFSELKRN